MTGNRREPPWTGNVRLRSKPESSGFAWKGGEEVLERLLRLGMVEVLSESGASDLLWTDDDYWARVRIDVLAWARGVRRKQYPPVVEEW